MVKSMDQTTIMLVDDNNDLREVTAAILSDGGYQVIEARNGAAALSFLSSGAIVDLMLMDLELPDISGIELAARVRGRWPRVNLLFSTGYAKGSGPRSQLSEEAVIEKPYTFDQLDSAVKQALKTPFGQNAAT